METLEQLKSIIDGAVDGDLFFDGRYLNKKLHVRGVIDKYSVKGFKSHIVYDAPLYVNTGKLRSLSDIKLIIELMERAQNKEPVKDECKHDDCVVHWDHHQCKSCGYVLTDGGFGCASRKWFQNIEAAKFYQKNGFLPR